MIDPYTKRYPMMPPQFSKTVEPPPRLEPPEVSRTGVDGGPVSRLGGEHVLREAVWAWPGRIPANKLTLVAGEPGVGKSMFAADLAARWTAGLAWPDGKPAGEPGSVIFLCAEDSLGDTVLPRFKAAGGDPSRVLSLHYGLDEADVLHPLTFPRDCNQLGAMVLHAAEPRLIVIDPLAAYLGSGGDWGGEMQARLSGLSGMAPYWQATILAVTHRDLRRYGPRGQRAAGAVGLLAGARAAFQVVADPVDADLRHVLSLKNNLGRLAGPLAFRIADDGHCVWQPAEPEPPTESEPPTAPAEPTERMMAGKWLVEVLSSGPVAATELFERGQAALFSRATLRRAARESGVRARCDGFQGKWAWELGTPPKNE